MLVGLRRRRAVVASEQVGDLVEHVAFEGGRDEGFHSADLCRVALDVLAPRDGEHRNLDACEGIGGVVCHELSEPSGVHLHQLDPCDVGRCRLELCEAFLLGLRQFLAKHLHDQPDRSRERAGELLCLPAQHLLAGRRRPCEQHHAGQRLVGGQLGGDQCAFAVTDDEHGLRIDLRPISKSRNGGSGVGDVVEEPCGLVVAVALSDPSLVVAQRGDPVVGEMLGHLFHHPQLGALRVGVPVDRAGAADQDGGGHSSLRCRDGEGADERVTA